MTDLENLAKNLAKAKEAEKKAKFARETAQGAFFKAVAEEWREKKKSLRPVTTITVPADFWDKTGMSVDEFLDTRFPGWELERVSDDNLVLRKLPEYMPSEINVDGTKVTKTVSEYTPVIDWDSLAKELPDLFEILAFPKTEYVLDEVELERLMEDRPEVTSELRRHMIVKPPALKSLASKSKKVEDG
jgi:hypothetical protein